MRRHRAVRAFLLTPAFLLSAGCEEPFEPIQTNELAFSVYGYLNASADTQWVRVTSLRTSLQPSSDLPGATVTLEHLGTGQVPMLHDSVFVYPAVTPVGGDLHARNFWTDVPVEEGGRIGSRRPGRTGSRPLYRPWWPYDPSWSNETTFLADVSLNIEGGVGFLGGVLTRTVPYETCYVIRPVAVEGVVQERTLPGCEPVPRAGATVFLWENDVPDMESSVEIQDINGAVLLLKKPAGVKVRTAYTRPDGTHRISALVPGMNYAVAVNLRGILYDESKGLTAEAGQALDRDIDVPRERAHDGAVTVLETVPTAHRC